MLLLYWKQYDTGKEGLLKTKKKLRLQIHVTCDRIFEYVMPLLSWYAELYAND